MLTAALLIVLALFQYVYFSVRVGSARGKYGIAAPSTAGDETWERLYRVQMNTLEQLVVFIPALLIFSYYTSPRWAWIPGVLFLVGRQLYAWEYVRSPPSRVPGMALTLLANGILLVGGLVGIVVRLL